MKLHQKKGRLDRSLAIPILARLLPNRPADFRILCRDLIADCRPNARIQFLGHCQYVLRFEDPLMFTCYLVDFQTALSNFAAIEIIKEFLALARCGAQQSYSAWVNPRLILLKSVQKHSCDRRSSRIPLARTGFGGL